MNNIFVDVQESRNCIENVKNGLLTISKRTEIDIQDIRETVLLEADKIQNQFDLEESESKNDFHFLEDQRVIIDQERVDLKNNIRLLNLKVRNYEDEFEL